MGILAGTTVYLAGPVEQDNDPNSWRELIKIGLTNMNVRIWDPLDKPDWIDRSFTGKAQRNDKYTLESMRFLIHDDPIVLRNVQIRNVALRLASAADFIVCKIGGPTVGTFEELALAKQCLKPILFFGDLDSSWRFAQFADPHYAAFHKNMDDLMTYLNKINDSKELVSEVSWIFTNNFWPNSQRKITHDAI